MKKLLLLISLTYPLIAMESVESDERSGKRQKVEHVEKFISAQKGIPTLVKFSSDVVIKHKLVAFTQTICESSYDDALGLLHQLPSEWLLVALKKVINEHNFKRMTNPDYKDKKDIAMQFAVDLAKPLAHNLSSFLQYAQEKNVLVERYRICKTMNSDGYFEACSEYTLPRCCLAPFSRTEILESVKGTRYIEAFGNFLLSMPWDCHRVSPQCRECKGRSYLHILVASGNVKLMKWILEHNKNQNHSLRPKIDINIQEFISVDALSTRYRPLHIATHNCYNPCLAMVKLLVDHGASVFNDGEMSPLHVAVSTDYYDLNNGEKNFKELKQIIDYLKLSPGSEHDHSIQHMVMRAFESHDPFEKARYPLIAYAYPHLEQYLQ